MTTRGGIRCTAQTTSSGSQTPNPPLPRGAAAGVVAHLPGERRPFLAESHEGRGNSLTGNSSIPVELRRSLAGSAGDKNSGATRNDKDSQIRVGERIHGAARRGAAGDSDLEPGIRGRTGCNSSKSHTNKNYLNLKFIFKNLIRRLLSSSFFA